MAEIPSPRSRVYCLNFVDADDLRTQINCLLEMQWGSNLEYLNFQCQPEPGCKGVAWVSLRGIF